MLNQACDILKRKFSDRPVRPRGVTLAGDLCRYTQEGPAMGLYCGIDLHSNNHVLTVIDEADRRVYCPFGDIRLAGRRTFKPTEADGQPIIPAHLPPNSSKL